MPIIVTAFVVFVFGPSASVMLEVNAILVGAIALLEDRIASPFTDTSHSGPYSMVTESLYRWIGRAGRDY